MRYVICYLNSVSFIVYFHFDFDTRIGADDDPQPERHPCPDFFDTCCILKSDEIIPTVIKTPIGKPEKCGIRNKNGAGFNLIERDNEAQFGKQ